MNNQIAIIAQSFFNPKDPESFNIGGVEAWILEFVRLLVTMGYKPVVYQTSVKDFDVNFEGAEIIGLGGLNRHKMTTLSHWDIERRGIQWIVYASSFVGERHFKPGQIFIQHGIHWDYTTSRTSFFQRIKWEIIRQRLNRNDLKKSRRSRLTICVDSNYLNYARVMLRHRFEADKIRYIPNFAVPQEKQLWQGKWDNPKIIYIIFARRFEYRRGTTIFAEAIEKILDLKANVRVTFAGGGSYDSFLQAKFKNSDRVQIQVVPHEQMCLHLNKAHIAVVPSTYSEGTSLSCLEAMASGCAVVVSDVGGLCNIVLPDFNGLMIRPVSSELTLALEMLIKDLPFAQKLANQGYDTLCQSFSLNRWQRRIRQALMEAGVVDMTKF